MRPTDLLYQPHPTSARFQNACALAQIKNVKKYTVMAVKNSC